MQAMWQQQQEVLNLWVSLQTTLGHVEYHEMWLLGARCENDC